MQIKCSNIGTEPITATGVKSWLKVDFTDEDTLITSLISQIRTIAEEVTGLSLIDKTIEYFEDDEDLISDWISLPYPVHDSITEVKVNGTATTNYVKTGLTQFRIKVSGVGAVSADNNGLIVKYTTTGDCPEGLKLAMLKAIADTYEKRGNTFEGSLVKLTDSFFNYLQQYKVY